MQAIEKFEKALENKGTLLYLVPTGSRAYNLVTPTSDEDYRGVFVPNKRYIFGLNHIEQQKVESDDWVAHSISQYVRLIIKLNPTMLETLFMTDRAILLDPEFKSLLVSARGLITKSVFHPYSAYIQAQLKKAKYRQPEVKRKELIERYGYDVKFMSHVARLAIQGAALLRTGSIPVWMDGKDRDLVLSIKQGAVDFKTATEKCEELDKDLYKAHKESILPDERDLTCFEKEVFIPFVEKHLPQMG